MNKVKPYSERTVKSIVNEEIRISVRDQNKTGDTDSYEYYCGYQDGLLLVKKLLMQRQAWSFVL